MAEAVSASTRYSPGSSPLQLKRTVGLRNHLLDVAARIDRDDGIGRRRAILASHASEERRVRESDDRPFARLRAFELHPHCTNDLRGLAFDEYGALVAVAGRDLAFEMAGVVGDQRGAVLVSERKLRCQRSFAEGDRACEALAEDCEWELDVGVTDRDVLPLPGLSVGAADLHRVVAREQRRSRPFAAGGRRRLRQKVALPMVGAVCVERDDPRPHLGIEHRENRHTQSFRTIEQQRRIQLRGHS